MELTRSRPDDCTRRSNETHSRDRIGKEIIMYQDSLSEGHIYWGRVAVILTSVIAFAYVASLL
jgi:hypothetical protein